MKLRNKKTGEIGKPAFIMANYDIAILPDEIDKKALYYSSLTELSKDWEDYKPKEPLIKDQKIRKAVRAWAEAECFEEVAVMCHLVWGEKMTEIANISNARQDIAFKGNLGIKMGNYTITELCGEEEE